jgi:phosphopantothenoylcysteine synthetase/decarboxylase
VTAGPTREAIDPVRYLSNRSSGRMGYAVAAAAQARGHDVTLVSGPTSLEVPAGVGLVQVESADDLYRAVEGRIGGADVAVMAAAVADFRPAQVSLQKIKTRSGERLVLDLVRTRDILGSAREAMGFGGLLVGFAAETEDVAANALAKLHAKGCDVIAANDVSRAGAGFDSPDNEIVLYFRDGREEPLGFHTKAHLGELIVRACERELAARADSR